VCFIGKDYFVGGWAAANYWRLTEQVPIRYDVYTTRRQGSLAILNTRFSFHRTTKKRISKSVIEKIGGRTFRIISKEDSKEWMKLRE